MAGKVVVITGAAGGIGRALGVRFGRAGAFVAALDRTEALASAAAADLRAEGILAIGERCDVTRPEDAEEAMASVASRLGGIDVLVNNAVITHLSRAAETDAKVLRAVMEVNFFGSVHCTRAALPALVERRGTIAVMSSVAGFAPLADRCGYAASKHALHGYFDTLRAELAPRGVRVTMVCPSFTRTAIAESALGGDGGRPDRPWSTVGRLASPEHVAERVYRGVVRGKRVVLTSMVGRAAWFLTRLAPAFYERLMVRGLRSAARAARAAPAAAAAERAA